jgi:hypothetical protein
MKLDIEKGIKEYNELPVKTFPGMVRCLGFSCASEYYTYIKNKATDEEVIELKRLYSSLVEQYEKDCLDTSKKSQHNALVMFRNRLNRFGWGEETIEDKDNESKIFEFSIVEKIDGELVPTGRTIDYHINKSPIVNQEPIQDEPSNLIEMPVRDIKDAQLAFRRSGVQADRDGDFDILKEIQ